MAKTDQELTDIAKVLAQRIFVEAGSTAHSDKLELKAAVQALDNGMDANTDVIQSAYPGQSLKTAIRDHIQATNPNLDTQQAGVILALWALHEVNLF